MATCWAWTRTRHSRAIVRYLWIVLFCLGVVTLVVSMTTAATPNLGAVLGVPLAIGLLGDRHTR